MLHPTRLSLSTLSLSTSGATPLPRPWGKARSALMGVTVHSTMVDTRGELGELGALGGERGVS
jgi:hypothetical protein